MKSTFLLTLLWTTLNVKFQFLPSGSLILVMGLGIVLDFLTGIIKSVVLKEARTSQGYRKTIVKFTQYGGSVLVGMLLKYIGSKNSDMANISVYADYLTDGLVIFIIFVEITSVMENIYAIDKETPFSKYLVGPLLKILTFQIKNNPVTRLEVPGQNQQNEDPKPIVENAPVK